MSIRSDVLERMDSDESVVHVRDLVQNDKIRIIREMAEEVGICNGSCQAVGHEACLSLLC
jgi:hypothetical protein